MHATDNCPGSLTRAARDENIGLFTFFVWFDSPKYVLNYTTTTLFFLISSQIQVGCRAGSLTLKETSHLLKSGILVCPGHIRLEDNTEYSDASAAKAVYKADERLKLIHMSKET